MSEAVYHNVALGAPNLTAVRADINHFPELLEKVDVVFCRGVLQHTEDPVKSMHALFENVKEGGYVIFDVYKKAGGFRIPYKYFWRPVVTRLFSEKDFDTFLKKHINVLYRAHHIIMRSVNSNPITRNIFGRLPFHNHFDWDKEYPRLPLEKRKEIFRNEQIDMFYAAYDTPMTPEEVIDALAKIGQTPYSYDPYRNHFRCRKSDAMEPIRVKTTKNGVVPVG
jgi:SAM-dependent methyltransferase